MLWNWLESLTSLWPLGTPPGDPGRPSSKPQAPPPVLRRAGHLPSQPRLQIHSSPAHLLQLWPSSAVGMRTSILDHCPLQGRGGLHLAPRACPRQWFLWNWCVWWDGGIEGGDPSPRSWHMSSKGEQDALRRAHGTPASAQPAPGGGFRAGVSARQGCCSNAPQTGRLSPQESEKSKAGSPRAGCRQAWLLCRFSRRTCPAPLSWPLVVCRRLCHPSACQSVTLSWLHSHVTSPCVHVCVEISPFCKDTCHTARGFLPMTPF